MTMRYYWCAICSAILFAIATPGPVFENGSMLIGILSLSPYFFLLFHCTDRRTVMRCAAVFSFLTTFITYYWLIFYQNFAIWAIGGVVLGHVAVHVILALVIVRIRICHPLWRPFVIAFIWSGFEYMTSIGYLAFPWGVSGLPATEWLLFIQHIELTGVWSLNFIVALANAIIAELMLQYVVHGLTLWWRQACCLFTMAILAILFGVYRMHTPLPIRETVPMLIVQQNTDAWNDGLEASLVANISLSREGMAHLPEGAPVPEMIIWSETSIGASYIEKFEQYKNFPAQDPLVSFITSMGIPLLSGTPYQENLSDGGKKLYNAGVLIDRDAQVIDYYLKRHLVPFAEHVPFWDVPLIQNIYTNIIGLHGTWNRGNVDPIMELAREGRPPLIFGVLICFEDSFGYLGRGIARRGGEVIINLTNNSWSRRRAAQIQHLTTARLRAIETRRALVRSTNSGESVLVNGYGIIEQRAPSFEKTYLYINAPIYDTGDTLYTRAGDYLGQFQMWVALLLWMGCISRRGKRMLSGVPELRRM